MRCADTAETKVYSILDVGTELVNSMSLLDILAR